jgi:hypothetical protein
MSTVIAFAGWRVGASGHCTSRPARRLARGDRSVGGGVEGAPAVSRIRSRVGDRLQPALRRDGAIYTDILHFPARVLVIQAARAAVGPIVPDLLGEFFVLMRLRGEAAIGDRQSQITTGRAKETLDACWSNDQFTDYAGLLLQDYLAWVPQVGPNPAVEFMQKALAMVSEGHSSSGLLDCCSASAWRKPRDRDWPK